MNVKNEKLKRRLFLFVVFTTLFLSYTINFWKITDDYYSSFSRSEEALLIARLDKSKYEGVFSQGGLSGSMVIKNADGSVYVDESVLPDAQYKSYLAGEHINGYYDVYRSHTCGHAFIYGVLQTVLPLKPSMLMQLFRIINGALTAFAFVLFIGWCIRNYRYVAGAVTFLLILLSPLLIQFGHNLWWALWSYYIPFLTALLFLEKRHHTPAECSMRKVYLCLSAAVFFKCFFTGYEFISPTLIAGLCPFIYYGVLEKQKMMQIVKTLFFASIYSILGVVSEMLLLLIQISQVDGSFLSGINYLFNTIIRRAPTAESEGQIHNFSDVIVLYFSMPTLLAKTMIKYGSLMFSIFLFCFCLYFFDKSARLIANSQKLALITTTFFSVLAPISWFTVFKGHSGIFYWLGSISWYIPFLLFGYLIIGVVVNIIFKIFSRKVLKHA